MQTQHRSNQTSMTSPQRLSYGSHPSQFIHLYSSPDPTALAIILHGGFWKSCYGIQPLNCALETLPSHLLSLNISVALVEYRRSEDIPWGWPHTNNDVLNACEQILQHHNKYPVFLVGHSAGGTLALWLVAQKRFCFAQTYALAPVADLRLAIQLKLSDDGDAVQNYMHGLPDDSLAEYELACPTMLAHKLIGENVTFAIGGNDRDVPERVVRSCYQRISQIERERSATHSTVSYGVFPNIDHYQIVNSSSTAWQYIAADMLRRTAESSTKSPG